MGRIKQSIRNLSIKKSFMLYMLIFLLLATALSSITINFATSVRNRINLSYVDSENNFFLENGTGEVGILLSVNYTKKDGTIINICNFVEIWSIPIFFGICIVFSALLFYNDKLKRPIEQLNEASEKIADNDLDFHIHYNSRDEMGNLCTSFEVMREALEKNNREMWRAIEERKRLNAAFSHDLRTPITVLRGYSDFLKNYLPQGKISEEKLISTISTMTGHISRLENYVQMMNEVQRLEDIAVSVGEVKTDFLTGEIRTAAEALGKNTGLNLKFINEILKPVISVDFSIVIRVCENLIANAVRYAENVIYIQYRYANEKLCITISDDGRGFTDEDFKQAIKPYYRNKDNTENDGTHFGLGLYICKLLCEKHGGTLLIENNSNGGAMITACFREK
ncbi:MAG: two-component system, OmpR family, lantibiotic biosynthesis sensor histidine kinase NisK/SpaK [Kosmotogales bacterium]|nr:two-component system, OmpR family, lantibiotic biosynthesis sensor histidine kinase NisK/SpaK [Kosmotogales bacterium]